MKIFALLLLFFGLYLLCGCSSGVEHTQTDTGHHGTTVSNGYGHGTIFLVVLEDGTKCAALVGEYKGAIDCKWDQQ